MTWPSNGGSKTQIAAAQLQRTSAPAKGGWWESPLCFSPRHKTTNTDVTLMVGMEGLGQVHAGRTTGHLSRANACAKGLGPGGLQGPRGDVGAREDFLYSAVVRPASRPGKVTLRSRGQGRCPHQGWGRPRWAEGHFQHKCPPLGCPSVRGLGCQDLYPSAPLRGPAWTLLTQTLRPPVCPLVPWSQGANSQVSGYSR